MYQPNFCAECGQRIERARWHWWTSRKFCSACARRLRRQRWTLPVAGCAALTVAGFTAGRAGRPAAPPLTLERAALVLPDPPLFAPKELGTIMQGTTITRDATMPASKPCR